MFLTECSGCSSSVGILVFLCGSSLPCIDVCVCLFVCEHVVALSSCLCLLYFGEVLCPAYDGCETDVGLGKNLNQFFQSFRSYQRRDWTTLFKTRKL
jgi:hypothetical protein